MLRAAVFMAREVIFTHLVGLKPDDGESAGDRILLDSKCGDVKTNESHPARRSAAAPAVQGHVQLVDLASAEGCWIFHIHCLPMTCTSSESLGGR